MAQNYYSVEKAAELLGVTAEEIRAMRERRELYGYRDGSNWKFKAEDVERLARQRQGGEEEGGGFGYDFFAAGDPPPGTVRAVGVSGTRVSRAPRTYHTTRPAPAAVRTAGTASDAYAFVRADA